ncbi:MAG: aminotransferase class V-fold PLP-dependent enzyme [Bacteroidota bacterium]
MTALQNAPNKIETGTLNHAAIAGVTAAVNFISSLGSNLDDAYKQIGEHERKLAIRLFDGINKIKGAKVIWTGFRVGASCTYCFIYDRRQDTDGSVQASYEEEYFCVGWTLLCIACHLRSWFTGERWSNENWVWRCTTRRKRSIRRWRC